MNLAIIMKENNVPLLNFLRLANFYLQDSHNIYVTHFAKIRLNAVKLIIRMITFCHFIDFWSFYFCVNIHQ